jgi:hypothetical protein
LWRRHHPVKHEQEEMKDATGTSQQPYKPSKKKNMKEKKTLNRRKKNNQ